MGLSERSQWHVLQDLVEQDVQLDDDVFRRFEPPPMPKEDKSFRAPEAPQSGQAASLSLPMRTRHSKRRPHFLQMNS
jgi:hypothetical protein